MKLKCTLRIDGAGKKYITIPRTALNTKEQEAQQGDLVLVEEIIAHE